MVNLLGLFGTVFVLNVIPAFAPPPGWSCRGSALRNLTPIQRFLQGLRLAPRPPVAWS